MDEPTNPKTTLATSTDDSKTFTQAVEAMKEQSKDEAQRTIASQDKMGKPQAFTEACSVMKDEIDREAVQILSPQDKMGKHQAFTEACSVMKDEIDREAEQILSPQDSTKKPSLRAADRKAMPTAIDDRSQAVERQSTPESGIK